VNIEVGTENDVVVLVKATVGQDASCSKTSGFAVQCDSSQGNDEPAWDGFAHPSDCSAIWNVAFVYSSETPDPNINNNSDWVSRSYDLTIS